MAPAKEPRKSTRLEQSGKSMQRDVSEHLVFRPQLPFSWQEMVAEKKILSPAQVRKYLEEARIELLETPGPHQKQRQELEKGWLDWWISFFDMYRYELDPDKARQKFLTLREVADQNTKQGRQGKITANFFANGLEGHAGHRHAIKHIVSILRKGFVGLLLDEEISAGKPREAHFLPLELRMCMWAYFMTYSRIDGRLQKRELDYIAIMPNSRIKGRLPEKVNRFYDLLFRATRSLFHFVMKGDPHFHRKLGRNLASSGWPNDENPWWVFEPFTPEIAETLDAMVFPPLDEAGTTKRTERLLPARPRLGDNPVDSEPPDFG